MIYVVIALFFVYAFAQIVAGFAGIDYHTSIVWAWVALGALLFLRFSLPITVGAFFGAMDVWGWPWYLALIFAAPGLLFIVPGSIVTAFSALRSKGRR